MILILSFEEFEQCTDPVIDWLLYYEKKFIKITNKDFYDSDSNLIIDVAENKFIYKNIDLIKEVNVIYYRRFNSNVNFPNFRSESFPITQVLHELKYEMEHLINFFFFSLKDKKWFPFYQNTDIDKLTSLKIAQSVGLKIPSTYITNNKEQLYNIIQNNNENEFIIKPIKYSGYYQTKGKNTYTVFTNSIKKSDVDNFEISNNFFPTLLQEKVKKDFELRIFYLDGIFFATAIIIDGDYDDVKRKFEDKNIHWEPYLLPITIEIKLNNLMKYLNLNTGSIDMIKTKENDYVFLEVNPVGQFIAPSRRCNYYIEKNIAEWLIKNDE